jgi:hypothetical protein
MYAQGNQVPGIRGSAFGNASASARFLVPGSRCNENG